MKSLAGLEGVVWISRIHAERDLLLTEPMGFPPDHLKTKLNLLGC